MSASILEINPVIHSDALEADVTTTETAASRPAGSTRYVTFFFGDDLYGLAAEVVAEVTHPLPISPLPHGPEFLSGIAPLRGEIVAVIDVGRILGRSAATTSARTKCVVLRKSENETQPAFEVDRMHELVTLKNASVNVDPRAASIVLGTAQLGGHILKVISPNAIRSALTS
jgi:purine-binding chemotaxis protein CheW